MADEQPKTLAEFVRTLPDGNLCPFLKNVCQKEKCKMWISTPTEEGEVYSDCGMLMLAANTGATVMLLQELCGQDVEGTLDDMEKGLEEASKEVDDIPNPGN